MNIYLVSRTDPIDYDEYDAFVVAANDDAEAMKTIGKQYGFNQKKAPVDIKLIGTAIQEKPEIILGSFRAG